MPSDKITEIQEYRDAFLREGRDHLDTMNESLLALEKTPGKTNLTYKMFHAAHSLKSMCGLMEYEQTETLCHAMEDILSAVRKKKLKIENCIDILFEAVDKLEAILKNVSNGKGELDSVQLANKLRRLNITAGGAKQSSDGHEIAAPLSEARDDNEIDDSRDTSDEHKPISAIEVKVERLDRLMNLAEELLVNKMWLDRIKQELNHTELATAVDRLDRLVTELQYDVMQSRLVPIGFVFKRFPRMVRDLAKKQKKSIELQVQGGDIELDRSIIDEIGESMIHLLRNAIDHGIEKPEDRKKAGKSPQATILLKAYRDKGFAVIEVEDDGAGLDVEDIKRVGLKKGVLTAQSSREDVVQSIFQGLSTTKQVSKISGRGFGLNIVKKKVESLGGVIRIGTEEGQGTTFRIEVPLTLAVIKSLFVNVSGKQYAVPVANVVRLVTVKRKDIKGMLRNEGVVLDEEDIPITRLNRLFKMAEKEQDIQPIVIVRKGEDKLGLAVDELMSTQEIVIKPLNPLVTETRYSNRYFAGSAIVGSGEAVLVLDVGNLILSQREMN